MKCYFCNGETNMTVRDSDRTLFSCCKNCKDEKNSKKIKLWISCIFKTKEVQYV